MGHRNPISIDEGNLHDNFNDFKKTLAGLLAPGIGAISTLGMLHVHGVYRDGQPCAFLPHTIIICEGDTFCFTGEFAYRDKDTGEIRTGFTVDHVVHAFTPAEFVKSFEEIEVDHE